jgi:hypothetical protein
MARSATRRAPVRDRPPWLHSALGSGQSLACCCPLQCVWLRSPWCADLGPSEPCRSCTTLGWRPGCHRGCGDGSQPCQRKPGQQRHRRGWRRRPRSSTSRDCLRLRSAASRRGRCLCLVRKLTSGRFKPPTDRGARPAGRSLPRGPRSDGPPNEVRTCSPPVRPQGRL